MFGYINFLRSSTSGRGTFTMEFDHYADVPPGMVDKAHGARGLEPLAAVISGADLQRRRGARSLCMQQSIFNVTLVVGDYDEAIAFFVGKLGFTLIEDTYIPAQDKRWGGRRRRRARRARGCCSRVPQRPSARRPSVIRPEARVGFFLGTDDFWRDYRAMTVAGLKFVREPTVESYGTVAVFEDLYRQSLGLRGAQGHLVRRCGRRVLPNRS